MGNEVRVWMDTAKQDWAVARHLFQTFHPMPVEVICYHCQQSAEKAVKALVISLHIAEAAPRVHDISYLLNALEGQLSVPEDCFDCADTLTPYGVAVRYPNELFLEPRHAEEALACAETILVWAEDILNQ